MPCLVFIPKKNPQEHQGIEYHEPGDVRQLPMVNTDDRLMANVVRMRVEPLLALAISPMQRGLLPGRSLIQNVVEVGGEMCLASSEGPNPALVFFDFLFASVSFTP